MQSWPKANFVVLGLLSFSRASKNRLQSLCSVYSNLVTTHTFGIMLYRYGVGYHMTMVKEESCDPSRVERAVKSVVPNAEQVTDVGAELSYILPSSSTPSFPQLFDKLEAEKTALGIQSFGISVTTMEEVFMKVGEGVEDERYVICIIILQGMSERHQ